MCILGIKIIVQKDHKNNLFSGIRKPSYLNLIPIKNYHNFYKNPITIEGNILFDFDRIRCMFITFVCFSNLIKVLNTLHENIEGERQRKSEKLFLYTVHTCYDVPRVWGMIYFVFY